MAAIFGLCAWFLLWVCLWAFLRAAGWADNELERLEKTRQFYRDGLKR